LFTLIWGITLLTTIQDKNQKLVKILGKMTRTEELLTDKETRGLKKIQHGIGIHFGPAIIGIIGTVNRLEYRVKGDTVNVASRIESACKELKENLLISRAVKVKIGDEIKIRELGNINVKGKSKSVQVFAVDGFIEKI